MSDPTKNLPWHVLNNSERAEPDWGVYDSAGQLVAWFPYGGHYARTSEQAEALARMVAAGSEAEALRAENEQLKATCNSYVANATTAMKLEDLMESLLKKVTAERDGLKSQAHELQLTTASQHTEYRELRKVAGELAAVIREYSIYAQARGSAPFGATAAEAAALAAYAALNPEEESS